MRDIRRARIEQFYSQYAKLPQIRENLLHQLSEAILIQTELLQRSEIFQATVLHLYHLVHVQVSAKASTILFV